MHGNHLLEMESIIETCIMEEGKRWYKVKWQPTCVPHDHLRDGYFLECNDQKTYVTEGSEYYQVLRESYNETGGAEYTLYSGDTWEPEELLQPFFSSYILSYWSSQPEINDIKIEENSADLDFPECSFEGDNGEEYAIASDDGGAETYIDVVSADGDPEPFIDVISLDEDYKNLYQFTQTNQNSNAPLLLMNSSNFYTETGKLETLFCFDAEDIYSLDSDNNSLDSNKTALNSNATALHSNKNDINIREHYHDTAVRHNILEQQRRLVLKENFNELRQCMPPKYNKTNPTKLSILTSAIIYIGFLKKQEKALNQQQKILQEENAELSNKLSLLSKVMTLRQETERLQKENVEFANRVSSVLSITPPSLTPGTPKTVHTIIDNYRKKNIGISY